MINTLLIYLLAYGLNNEPDVRYRVIDTENHAVYELRARENYLGVRSLYLEDITLKLFLEQLDMKIQREGYVVDEED